MMGNFHYSRQISCFRSGQVMIISIVALGGIFLGVTVVAGLLMTSQIREASDSQASTNAIAAADAGLEWGLYRYTYPTSTNATAPLSQFSNGAAADVRCYEAGGNELTTSAPAVPDCGNSKTSIIRSYGVYLDANRILEISDVQPFTPQPPLPPPTGTTST